MTARHPMVAAQARLYELATARFGDSVRVDQGVQQGSASALDCVVIGLASPEDVSAGSGTVEYPTPRGQSTEHLDIPCIAQSVSGDADALTSMDRCFELVDVMAELLEGDVESPVAWGRISRHATQWVKTKAGFGALVLFAVTADAYRAGRRG